MKLRNLRLLEFAPNRTQFNQILSDQSISMGFECEMVTPFETGSGREGLDVDNMSWSEVESEVEISSRVERRIESSFDEWRSDQVDEMMDRGWREDKDDYMLSFCLDNDHLIRRSVVAANGTSITLQSTDSVEEGMNAIDDQSDSVVVASVDEDARTITLENPFDSEPSPGDRLNFTPAGQDVDDVLKEWRHEAREAYEEENRDGYWDQVGDMDDWIDNNFSSMSGFLNHYGIYYDEGGDDDDGDEQSVHRDMAYDLRSVVNQTVQAEDAYSKNPNSWYVESDGSLRGDGYATAEVVSSVYPLGEGLTALKTIFDWMEANGYSTNRSTGLHVSFSLAGKDEDDFDFLKMMVLFDENYTANLFDRMGAYYAKQMRNVLFAGMNSNGQASNLVASLDERQLDSVIDRMREFTSRIKFGGYQIGESKYFSFRHRANGVVEFRSMGGQDYESMYDIIRKRIVNMAYLMKVGSDPHAMARDYVSRMYKMLTSSKFADPKLGSGIGRVDQPSSLGTFASVMARDPVLTKLATTQPLQFVDALLSKLSRAAGGVSAASVMNQQQVRQLRWYIARNKIQAADFRKGHRDSEYNQIATLMRWPLVIPGQHDDRQQPLGFALAGDDQSGNPPDPEPESYTTPGFRGRNREQGEFDQMPTQRRPRQPYTA